VLFTPLPNPGNARIDSGALGCWGVSHVALVRSLRLPLPKGLICVDCVENEGCIVVCILLYNIIYYCIYIILRATRIYIHNAIFHLFPLRFPPKLVLLPLKALMFKVSLADGASPLEKLSSAESTEVAGRGRVFKVIL